MPTLQEYLDFLIPAPNRIQPKFIAWVSANLQLLLDAQDLMEAVITAFHIDDAVGQQLNILGEILGRPRRVNFAPSEGSAILEDEDYRLILIAKIIQNQWQGTKSEIYDFWDQHFPDKPLIVVDNGDMTIDVVVVGMESELQQQLVENFYYFPKPAGVLVNFQFTEEPLFAYDFDTDHLKGYDEAVWATV
jgi:hypothetical protein